MPRLADTIATLAARHAGQAAPSVNAPTRLSGLSAFGSNPGQLGALTFVPKSLSARAALVVVLHGCTQTAERYDRGSGWSELAEERGFALLYPEQTRANNANLCFNWFEAADTGRGGGEALSIRQMIAAMVAAHDLDPARVFITGLSAGGAMTAAMLAAYPEVFAGGAVIAGLPSGAAVGVSQALQRMQTAEPTSERVLAARVRAASFHAGPWPTLSVWHGDADRTVDAGNGRALVAQWRAVHGLDQNAMATTSIDGHTRQRWRAADGRDVIEQWTIAGMGHGTPLATRGPEACGKTGAHMLDVGISSTHHIARFWGLLDPALETAQGRSSRARPALETEPAAVETGATRVPAEASGPGRIIEDALRAAGLMR